MTVRYDVADGVATVTLHRPEVRNAFGAGMGQELDDAYRRADADDGVRAIVLTGTPPAFCAGADMTSGGSTFNAPDERTFSAAAVKLPAWKLRKPVIAAVNGHAIGVGFTITLHCDLRIFAADGKYGVVQSRRGVMGDAYSHWTLPRLVGIERAADILFTGRTFDGHEAKELGVCSRVLPNDQCSTRRSKSPGTSRATRRRSPSRTASTCSGRASSSIPIRWSAWRPSITIT